MSNHQLLDEELPNYQFKPLSSKLLGLAWLGLGIWLLYFGWDAYQLAKEGQTGLLVLFTYSVNNAYPLFVQSTIALILGALYISHNKQIFHFVFGALIAGTVFHFIDAVYTSTFNFIVADLEHLISGLLIFTSWRNFDPFIVQKIRSNLVFLSLAILLMTISELSVYNELSSIRATGIVFFWILLWKTFPLSWSALVQEKRWYYAVFPFVGVVPFFLIQFLP